MPQSLPARTLILFGLVNLPLSMLMSPTAAILPNYYIDHTAVTLGMMATVTLASRLFDGVTDPVIGVLSDRLGSRKPLMLIGALVCALSVWHLFTPAPDAGLGYLLRWYLLLVLGWTLVEIPHSAMAAELSRDYQQRNRISMWRQILGFAGGVLFMASPMLLGQGRAFTPQVMAALAAFVALALPLTLVVMCWRIPEPRIHGQHRIRLGDMLQVFGSLPWLRHFLLTQVLFGLATGAVSALFVIYASQYLGLGDSIARIALPFSLAMALSMPLWLQLLRRVEKHRLWAVSAPGVMAVLLVIINIEPGPGALMPMTLAMILFGSMLGLASLVLPSMLGDLVDADLAHNGRDRAGILFAFQALVIKLNQGVGGAIGLSIPAWFGFSAEGALTDSAVTGLKLAFAGWPCLLLVPVMVLAWRYPLDRKTHAQLGATMAAQQIPES